MLVQINSDESVKIPVALAKQVISSLEGALARFSDQITRVEVHLEDANADKGGANALGPNLWDVLGEPVPA